LHRLFESRPFKVRILFSPPRRQCYFERIGRRRQHLCQQRIGIERNRRDQLCELLLGEGLLLWLHLRLGLLLRLLLALLILSQHRQ
jgi:hypothetical protein